MYFGSNRFANNEDKYNELGTILDKFIKENNTKYFGCNATINKVGDSLVTRYSDDDIIINESTGLVKRITFHTINAISVTDV